MELERIIKVLEMMKEYKDNKNLKSYQKEDVCTYLYNRSLSQPIQEWKDLKFPIGNPLGIKDYKQDGDGRDDKNRISFKDSKEIIEALNDFLL